MYEIRKYITQMSIARGDASPVYSENALSLTVDDESSGWFYVLEDSDGNKIRLDLDDLRALLECAAEVARQEPKDSDG